MNANDPTDKAASFLNWLAAGREFCDPADLAELRGRVLTRERAFLAALEGTTAPAAPSGDVPANPEPAAPRKGGGAHRTTSALILDELRAHRTTSAHGLIERIVKTHPDVSTGSVNAALYRLSNSGTVKKTGRKGDYHFKVAAAA